MYRSTELTELQSVHSESRCVETPKVCCARKARLDTKRGRGVGIILDFLQSSSSRPAGGMSFELARLPQSVAAQTISPDGVLGGADPGSPNVSAYAHR